MCDEKRIALIGVIVENQDAVEEMNHLLHDYREHIIGRMGIPHPEKKLSIISTFSVIASSSGMSSFSLLSSIFTPAGAISFMVFCLLYVPCIATLATVRKETGSWRCSIIMCFGHILLAWSVCFVIYNIFSHL